jgi:hypothetical protein
VLENDSKFEINNPNNIKKRVTAVRKAIVFIKKLKKTLIIYNILILD